MTKSRTVLVLTALLIIAAETLQLLSRRLIKLAEWAVKEPMS